MKIGILTFHWAKNYGAVLQTYALLSKLKQLGNDPVIINRVPTWNNHMVGMALLLHKPAWHLQLSQSITTSKSSRPTHYNLQCLKNASLYSTPQ